MKCNEMGEINQNEHERKLWARKVDGKQKPKFLKSLRQLSVIVSSNTNP